MKKRTVTCPCYLFYEEDSNGNKVQNGIIGINPIYSTREAACADVALPYRAIIPAHSAMKLDLWLGFEIPIGYKIIMYPRSSLLIKKGLMQPVSIIDQDYSGQRVHVPLLNITDKEVIIEKGERIAQIECVPTYTCEDWAQSNSARAGGFGSTGV